MAQHRVLKTPWGRTPEERKKYREEQGITDEQLSIRAYCLWKKRCYFPERFTEDDYELVEVSDEPSGTGATILIPPATSRWQSIRDWYALLTTNIKNSLLLRLSPKRKGVF